MAVRYPRSAKFGGEEILWKILRRFHRSHQHTTITVYFAEGRSDPWRGVSRECELRLPDPTPGQSRGRQ